MMKGAVVLGNDDKNQIHRDSEGSTDCGGGGTFVKLFHIEIARKEMQFDICKIWN